jgi:NAD(P)-dependent dehydrogenase (short-subunit alcohol dehydrogenase family)
MATENKIAVVTGGSRGLGKNIALRLATDGIDIILTYRSKQDEAGAVVQEIEQKGRKAAALRLDTGLVGTFNSFLEEVSATLNEKWGRATFDFLINNAGIDAASPFAQTTEEDFDNLFNIHLKGVYFLTQKSLPFLADKGGIVNVSTGLTRFTTPGYAAYASMKGAVEIFTKYLAKELGSRGIRANLVAAREAHPELDAFISSQTALGRMGLPDDIGGVVAFLCSTDARWVNAQRIEASGGMFL